MLKTRLHLCAALSLFCTVPLGARLTQLQVLQHRALSAIAESRVERQTVELIPRGRILDRNGEVLAESLPSWSAFLDPSALKHPEREAPRLAAALGLDRRTVALKAKRASRFVWLKQKLTPEEVARLRALKMEGVGLLADERRYNPNGELALNLLGGVGADGRGLAGLELSFDSKLRGKAQTIDLVRDGLGKTMTDSMPRRSDPPADLVLSLDRSVQHYAEAALKTAVERYRPAWASILVQDPRSGDILAMASHPRDPLRNPAIEQAFEPGSTFKAVSMAAVLEEGVAAFDEKIDCSGPWEVVPRVFIRDHEPSGPLSLEEIMSRSSNIGIAKLALRLGADRFHRAVRAFGFGTKTALGLPGESGGLLQSPASKGRLALANNAFGQGLAVTPLQLLGAYSALANGGSLLEPRLVLSSEGGRRPAEETTGVPVRRVASEDTVRRIVRMLEAVVERGTGISAQIPGYSVAGKTGTSQKLDPERRRYSTVHYVASFAGFIPAKQPRLTIVVVIDSPKGQYYGAEVAAPVFATLGRQLLALKGIPPERPLAVRWSSAPKRL